MVKALFDSNILIDHLNGVEAARHEIDRHADGAISVVTWIEVMVGASSAAEGVTRLFLESFSLVGLDQAVAERAVALRKTHRIRLPDAVIWASAQEQGRILVTRNVRDFPSGDPGARHPYELAPPF